METPGPMTLVYDGADGFKRQAPRRLQGCITDAPPGGPIGCDHDKYLYGR